jgi:uncharacterized membrane protein
MEIHGNIIRKTTIIGCSILCVLPAAYNFFFAATHAQSLLFRNLISGVLLLGFAFAIFRQYRWALRLAAAICLFVAFILPISLFNPFIAGDYMAAGKEVPSVMGTLLWLIPLEALLLIIVFIIDPKKTGKDQEQSRPNYSQQRIRKTAQLSSIIRRRSLRN